MIAVSALIYAAAGAPAMPADTSGQCRLCGRQASGMPFQDWVKDTFTDHDKLGAGTIACAACLFCASEATPGLAERIGKTTPQKFRNYSHFVVDGRWHPLSKADKSTMRALLFCAPDVALIALSGQKHLFFRALPGWWQIEETRARPFPADLQRALALIEPLYRAGISKTEIETGRYSPNRVLAVGLTLWRAAETQIAPLRGSLPLLLALFLAQKEKEEPHADT